MDTEREKNPERQERELGPFSSAVREKKEQWYSRVPLTERQLTVIIRVVYVLLAADAVLIALEAAGIFRL